MTHTGCGNKNVDAVGWVTDEAGAVGELKDACAVRSFDRIDLFIRPECSICIDSFIRLESAPWPLHYQVPFCLLRVAVMTMVTMA
jgi:hypothetical protein